MKHINPYYQIRVCENGHIIVRYDSPDGSGHYGDEYGFTYLEEAYEFLDRVLGPRARPTDNAVKPEAA